MMKEVIEGHVDFVANGFWKTEARLQEVYFTFPFDEEISKLN